MPETRYADVYKDGVLIGREPYEVSDEQLAEEAEASEIEKIKAILAENWTTAKTQEVVKKLIVRLLKKGVLP